MITKEQIETEIEAIQKALAQLQANVAAHQGALEMLLRLREMCATIEAALPSVGSETL